jgi:UDP-N-acetylglucosamine 2-epimerase (non-hydrolysing)/GDP/UDP-N,N'-diacetylbacillosamine 2-epimerase (hydrolysing)
VRKRKICVVTGSRADFGLLFWIMQEIAADPALDLQLVVTGTHLVGGRDAALAEMKRAGLRVAEKVEMLLATDSPVAIAKAMALGTIGFAEVFERRRPDLLLILGDRYEIFAAAQAALVARLPIAHLHGGERTEGAIDEAIRHAITKMAHLHFVAAAEFRRRVIQLGEDPERVFVVGAPGLEAVRRAPRLGRAALERDLQFRLDPPLFLITWHPETLSPDGGRAGLQALLEALDRFPQARLLWTWPHADPQASALYETIAEFAARHRARVLFTEGLGLTRYVAAMRLAAAVIGNSSSGIIEAPFLKVPSVNIGDRQKGRPRAASVIDCAATPAAIEAAIARALSPSFRAACRRVVSPYGDGDVAREVVRLLKTYPLQSCLTKTFYDLDRGAAWPER